MKEESESKEIAERNENLPTGPRTSADYFADYGNQAAQRNIVGSILKFSKGDYTAGMNDEPVDEGTQMLVNMNSLTIGWQKWVDSKPADAQMGLVTDGFQVPRRKELGDLDEDEWEVDESTGKPRDPWQFTNLVVMRQVGTSGDDEGLFTYATNSRGGINAIGALCKTYSKHMREHPGLFPVIELNVDSYKHSNKQYGTIKTPLFDVVGWLGEDAIDDASEAEVLTDEALGGDEEVVDAPRRSPTKAVAAAKKPVAKKAEPAKGKSKKAARF